MLSLGELVGVVEHAHTLHLPSHTQQERDFFIAFRSLCRQRLSLFQTPNTNSEKPNTSGTRTHPRVLEVVETWRELKVPRKSPANSKRAP